MTSEPARPSPSYVRLHLALLLVVLLVVARTLVLDRETAQERVTSDAITDTLEALSATKLGYSPDLILTPQGKSHSTLSDALDARQGKRVTAEWRKLATARSGRAAEWRRLGITLALFHQKGGLQALRHVADHFPPPPSMRKGHIVRGRADPFGHRPTSVAPADEIALWNDIYGTRPLTPAQTDRDRRMLAQLQLGWFENVAAAQLYVRAGQRDRARLAADAAAQSVNTLWRLQWLNLAVMGVGFLGLLALFVYGLVILAQRAASSVPVIGSSYGHAGAQNTGAALPASYPFPVSYPPHASSAPYPPPASAPGAYNPPIQPPDAVHAGRQRLLLFPYPALLLAFITYLFAHEGVGLLASLALSPFRARLEQLPATQLLRFTQVLQIVAYIPILGLPLLILRRRVRFDPLSGEPITWRKLLACIGFRINNPIADLGAGVVGYLCVTPAVVMATLFSNWLFARFHTPQNPAALEMLAAQHNLDRFLVLFVASVAAPFAEETMFRGILYSALRSRLGVWGGALLSGAIFALVHPTLPGGFLPIMAVGVGLALVYEWRKSLLPGMVLHGIYNGLITLITFAIFAR
jgi:membrane protease YdiL (CAAX protease family)